MIIGHQLLGQGVEGVIVLHGWFADHTVFAPMLASLDTSGFKFAFMDYRGYGLSREISGAHTFAEIVRDAVDLADHLGWQRFHVVGHSMGGSAAQRLCLDAQVRVKSCVCITPVPASGVPMQGEELQLFSGAGADDANRRRIIDYSTGGRLPSPWLDHMVLESRRTTTRPAFDAYFQAWSGTDFAAEATGLQTAMLVAVGEHDPGLTESVMRATMLRWCPNAVLEVIPNAGHYPMQETPIYLAGLICRFLSDHSKPAPVALAISGA
jgi:pimeloyl-ACP methyl ester carboxylesterase